MEELRPHLVEALHKKIINNYFKFLDDFYLQICGTAIGTIFVPSFANLHMGSWENKYIYQNNRYQEDLYMYKRYTDDIVIIWKSDQGQFFEIFNWISNNEYNLKFTYNFSSDKVEYLDLTLSQVNEEIITTKYIKPVDTNSYLHFKSAKMEK